MLSVILRKFPFFSDSAGNVLPPGSLTLHTICTHGSQTMQLRVPASFHAELISKWGKLVRLQMGQNKSSWETIRSFQKIISTKKKIYLRRVRQSWRRERRERRGEDGESGDREGSVELRGEGWLDRKNQGNVKVTAARRLYMYSRTADTNRAGEIEKEEGDIWSANRLETQASVWAFLRARQLWGDATKPYYLLRLLWTWTEKTPRTSGE